LAIGLAGQRFRRCRQELFYVRGENEIFESNFCLKVIVLIQTETAVSSELNSGLERRRCEIQDLIRGMKLFREISSPLSTHLAVDYRKAPVQGGTPEVTVCLEFQISQRSGDRCVGKIQHRNSIQRQIVSCDV